MPLNSAIRRRESIPLRNLVEDVCRPLESQFSAQAIELVIDIPPGETVFADRNLLSQAAEKLVLHAIESMPDGGSLVATSAAAPHGVELEIAHTGPRLSDEERKQAFEQLPTAQSAGSGWGLAAVNHIARLHGGSVTAVNCPDGGVAFTLRIPRPPAREAAA